MYLSVHHPTEASTSRLTSSRDTSSTQRLTVRQKALLDAGRSGTCLTADPRLERVQWTVSRLKSEYSKVLRSFGQTKTERTTQSTPRTKGDEAGTLHAYTPESDWERRAAGFSSSRDEGSSPNGAQGGSGGGGRGEQGGKKLKPTTEKTPTKRQKVDQWYAEEGFPRVDEGCEGSRPRKEDGVRSVKREKSELNPRVEREEERAREEEEEEAKRERLSERWVLRELFEEVLGAELVDLNPEEDEGPTLVVFVTGRPILIYRAFSLCSSFAFPYSPCSSSDTQHSEGGSCVDPPFPSPLPRSHSSASPSSDGNKSVLGSPAQAPWCFPEAQPLFPFRFVLTQHDVTHPIPSRFPSLSSDHIQRSHGDGETDMQRLCPREGEEEEDALPVTCTGYVVPYMGIGGCGRGALVIPPGRRRRVIDDGWSLARSRGEEHKSLLPSSGASREGCFGESSREEDEALALLTPPVLWLTSERNQVFVHPHARKDIIAVAPFHVESSTPQA